MEFSRHRLIALMLTVCLFAGGTADVALGQTLRTDALKHRASLQKRAQKGERTKVKLLSDVSHTGTISEAGDSTFTITTKTGERHVIPYSDVRSVGGTGISGLAKLGIGIGIGAGAVLAVLAVIVHRDNIER